MTWLINWKLLGLAALFFAGFAAGWSLKAGRCASDMLEIQESIASAKAESDQKELERATKAEKEIARLRSQSNAKTQARENEIRKPSYNCLLPSDGVWLYRSSLSGYAASDAGN